MMGPLGGGAAAGVVTIAGTPGVGNVLTAVPSPGWTFPGGQWYRALAVAPYTLTAIANATALTYVQVTADQGYVPAFTPTSPVYTALGTKVPVPAPVVTTAPILAASNVGNAVTWSAGVATGAASGTYSLRTAGGAEVATASGQYTPTTQGVQLTVVYTAVGVDGQTTSAMSNTVTVGAADPYMIVSSRVGSQLRNVGASSAGHEYQGGQTVHTPSVWAIVEPKLVYWAIDDSENNLGNTRQIEAAHIQVNGVRTAVTFNGGNQGGICADGGMLVSDPVIGLTIPANTVFYTGTHEYTPTGAKFIRSQQLQNNLNLGLQDTCTGVAFGSDAGGTSTSYKSLSVTGSTAAYTAANPGFWIPSPQLILGRGWVAAGKPPVPIILGDSIGDGFTGSVAQASGLAGFVDNGLATATNGRMGFANFCKPGMTFGYITGQFAKRAAFLSTLGFPYSMVIDQMGTNSGGAIAGSNGLIGASDWIKANLGNKWLVQLTLIPKSIAVNDATIKWTDPNNYTAEVFNANINAFIKNLGKVAIGSSGTTNSLDAYIDTAAAIEFVPGASPAKFAVLNSAVLAVDYASGATTVTLDRAVVPPIGLMIGIGTSDVSTMYFKNVAPTVSGSNYIYSVNALAKNFTAGITLKQDPTDDGVHPNTETYAALAVPLAAAKSDSTKFK